MSSHAQHEIDDAMVRLREHGLSYPSIQVVLELYHGWRLPADTIRYRCRHLGCRPRPQGQGNCAWQRNGWVQEVVA